MQENPRTPDEIFICDDLPRSSRGNLWFKIWSKNEIIHHRDVLYHRIPGLEQFQGSKVLLVGGGPSTIDCPWNPDQYDHVCSCNLFYLHPRLSDIKVSLTLVNSTRGLNKPRFRAYMKKFNPYLCLSNFKGKADDVKKYMAEYENAFVSRLRYSSIIGTMVKLVCTMVGLGAKEIHFVGMDGYSKDHDPNIDTTPHAFLGVSNLIGQIYSYEGYYREYKMFWEYMLELAGDVIFQNLGEGHPSNISTNFSKKYFPLRSV